MPDSTAPSVARVAAVGLLLVVACVDLGAPTDQVDRGIDAGGVTAEGGAPDRIADRPAMPADTSIAGAGGAAGAAGAGGIGGTTGTAGTGGTGGSAGAVGTGGAMGGAGGSDDKRAAGATCARGVQCVSGFCVDGVCCQTACAGVCQACDVPGSAGSCTPVPAGQDPADECATEAAATCGRDGTCDGAGACRMHAVGSACAPAACAAGVESSERTCDGKGVCRPATTKRCEPYVCAGAKCAATCAGNADCTSGSFCSGGSCSGLKAAGASCGGAGECVSKFCVDGVCCESACTGACVACNLAGSTGSCAPVAAGQDPANECATEAASTCGRDGSCDGAGACRRYAVGTACAAAACTNAAATPARTCDGNGTCRVATVVACAPYACAGTLCGTGCTDAGGCASGYLCDGGRCVSGILAVTSAARGAANVDLAAEGTLDWVFWGRNDAADVDRKAGVTPQLQKANVNGTPGFFGNRPPLYSWTGGTPTASANDVHGGIFIGGPGNGFDVTVPAGTTPRTLKVYLGAWECRARLHVSVSDASSMPYTSTAFMSTGTIGDDIVWTIRFAARTAGQTLTVRWTVDGVLGDPGGNVTLQAATLR